MSFTKNLVFFLPCFVWAVFDLEMMDDLNIFASHLARHLTTYPNSTVWAKPHKIKFLIYKLPNFN